MKKLMLLLLIIINIGHVSVFGENTELTLTAEEQAWLKDHPVIYYAPDPTYAPYEFFEEGELKGITADYLRLFEDLLGVEFKVLNLESWANVVKAAKDGQVDMIFVTKTQDRNAYLSYTTPIIDYPNVIVASERLTDDISEMTLDTYSIAYMKDYAVGEYIHLLYPDAKIIVYDDMPTAIKDVSEGKVDTFIGDIGQISYNAYKLNIEDLEIKSETAYKYSLRFGFPKDHLILRGIIEKSLSSIEASKKESITSKWIKLQYDEGLTETQQLFLLFALILLVLVIIIVLKWNRTLRKQVEDKTGELKALNSQLEEKVKDRTKNLEATNIELEASVEDLIAAQEKLVEAQKNALLGELIVGIAHEVSTPVGSSLTSISYLQEKTNELTMSLIRNELSLKDVATYADMTLQSNQSIINNLERVSKIIERFMSLESTQWSGHKENVHLGDVFKDIIEHVGEFDYRLMSYDIQCKDDSKSFVTATSWWYEILKALMMNSLLHGYKGLEKGEIRIHIREMENRIEIAYEDHGKGIDADHIEKVFEPFYTTSNDHEHIGLGLPILKNLINREMNGSMMIESEVGDFTRILISIPKA